MFSIVIKQRSYQQLSCCENGNNLWMLNDMSPACRNVTKQGKSCKRTDKYTWILIVGIILASTYIYAVIAAGVATTGNQGMLTLIFFFYVAPALTTVGAVFIIIYIVLENKSKNG